MAKSFVLDACIRQSYRKEFVRARSKYVPFIQCGIICQLRR
jgi:hypothetical protein